MLSIKCLLNFGCSNLKYIATRVVSGGCMDDDKVWAVYVCLDCGKEVLKDE